MEVVQKPMSWIHPSETNTRIHPEHQINEFVRSIKKFDVIRPIVTDENGRILVGHGLFTALQKMGRETADVMVISGLSESEKKKLVLSDNKIYSLGVDDYSGIEKILQDLAGSGDFDVPGYDSETLDELYGIRSVENSVSETPAEQEYIQSASIQPSNAQIDGTGNTNNENIATVPSRQLQDAREKAMVESNKFIICPNCGEKIFI